MAVNNQRIAYNFEAEKALITVALSGEDKYQLILTELSVDDFYDRKHKLVFDVVKDLYYKQVEISIPTVSAELENRGYLETVGGTSYLSDLLNDYEGQAGVEDNIKLIKDKSVIRKLFLKNLQLENDYFSKNNKDRQFSNDSEFLNVVDHEVNSIIQNRQTSGFKTVGQVAEVVGENMEKAKRSGKGVIGIDTGYGDLNKLTNGIQKSELWIIAARPSVGKTTFALNVANYVAKHRDNKPKSSVLFFSLEMESTSVVQKIIAQESGIDLRKITNGTYSKQEEEILKRVIKEVQSNYLFIDDTSGNKLEDIEAKSIKFKNEHPDLSLIVIDYLGLIQTSIRYESERVRVGTICHRIHDLARKLSVPIILISQLSRSSSIQKRRPQLSDLRDSGDIEQDADKVILLYRSDYEKQELGEGNNNQFENDELNDVQTSITEILLQKNRTGQTGTVYLGFNKNTSSFSSLTNELIEAYKKSAKMF